VARVRGKLLCCYDVVKLVTRQTATHPKLSRTAGSNPRVVKELIAHLLEKGLINVVYKGFSERKNLYAATHKGREFCNHLEAAMDVLEWEGLRP